MEEQIEPETQISSESFNDLVKTKVHLKPLCRVEIDVELPPSFVKKNHDQAVKQVRKSTVIDGFRKGRAPLELVEKKHPKPVDTEWQKLIASTALNEALRITKIPLLNKQAKINYSLKSYSLHEGATLTLFFETEPSVPEVIPSDITLTPVDHPTIDEKELNATIRQLQFFFTHWETVTDRPIQENDFVILDVDVIDEDPPKNLFAHVRFEVTDQSMAKWMKDLVLGKNLGEVLEGTSVPDEDLSDEVKASFKPRKVRVKIKKIETTTLPELNDEFSKRLGVSSMEEAKTNIKHHLNKRIETHIREKQREEVREIFLNRYLFDVPESLVDQEVRFRMEQLLRDSEYLDHWSNMTEEARRQALISVKEQSKKAVRMFYLCRKILLDGKISLSLAEPEALDDSPIALLLNDRKKSEEKSELHRLEYLSRLMLERAEDYVIDHASRSSLDPI